MVCKGCEWRQLRRMGEGVETVFVKWDIVGQGEGRRRFRKNKANIEHGTSNAEL
jgi:hypothetical protein